ncbi:MAG TPA: hypothetical protein VKY31_07220, partial [Terriglobia bacterium]|nr:hypothetical protein [Terriglobia bacterium]
MFSRLFLVFGLVLGSLTPAFSQATNVTMSRDVRLFATMAALNAAGYDIEFGSEYYPVRAAVRKYAADADPNLIAQLKQYYSTHKGTETDEAQL